MLSGLSPIIIYRGSSTDQTSTFAEKGLLTLAILRLLVVLYRCVLSGHSRIIGVAHTDQTSIIAEEGSYRMS